MSCRQLRQALWSSVYRGGPGPVADTELEMLGLLGLITACVHSQKHLAREVFVRRDSMLPNPTKWLAT